MQKTIIKSIILSIIFILVGIVSIFLGMNKVNEYKEKKGSYTEVNATVVGYDDTGLTDDDEAYIVYEYSVGGVKYRTKSVEPTTNLPSIGDTVTILYNPSNPNEIISSGGPNYTILIVGIVFSAVGLLALFRTIGLKKASADINYNNTNINDVAGPNN